ncbi:hypothetical protein LguiB_006755 [Lonicera macranthoides]
MRVLYGWLSISSLLIRFTTVSESVSITASWHNLSFASFIAHLSPQSSACT